MANPELSPFFSTRHRLTRKCGTDGFMAPEIIRNQPYDQKAPLPFGGVHGDPRLVGLEWKIRKFLDDQKWVAPWLRKLPSETYWNMDRMDWCTLESSKNIHSFKAEDFWSVVPSFGVGAATNWQQTLGLWGSCGIRRPISSRWAASCATAMSGQGLPWCGTFDKGNMVLRLMYITLW